MTDTLLDAISTNDGADENGDTASPESETATDTPGTPGNPPAGLPEKFWDSERGELRSESLIKSYQALEQKLGTLAGRGAPDDPATGQKQHSRILDDFSKSRQGDGFDQSPARKSAGDERRPHTCGMYAFRLLRRRLGRQP